MQQKGANSPKNPGSNPELNTIAAILSTGPVGISDKVGYTNSTLIMRTCDANGTLLQPSKPLTPSDRMFTEIGDAGDCPGCRGGLPQDGSSAQLWSTYSEVGETTVWFTVGVGIGADCTSCADIPLPLSTVDLYPPPAEGWSGLTLIHRHWHSACKDGADAVASGCIATAAPDLRSTNRSAGTNDLPFDLITSQAAGSGKWVLLGELDKYTTVSSQRFSSISAAAGGLDLVLAGVVGETVVVTALKERSQGLEVTEDGKGYSVVVKTATIGADGSATLQFK